MNPLGLQRQLERTDTENAKISMIDSVRELLVRNGLG